MAQNDEKLAAEIAKIQELVKDNKNLDANALIANLLARGEEQAVPSGQKARAYLVSLLFPPFGLYYAAKFFWLGTVDARRVAWICLAMTAVAAIVLWALVGSIASSVPELNQIQNLNSRDIQELLQ